MLSHCRKYIVLALWLMVSLTLSAQGMQSPRNTVAFESTSVLSKSGVKDMRADVQKALPDYLFHSTSTLLRNTEVSNEQWGYRSTFPQLFTASPAEVSSGAGLPYAYTAPAYTLHGYSGRFAGSESAASYHSPARKSAAYTGVRFADDMLSAIQRSGEVGDDPFGGGTTGGGGGEGPLEPGTPVGDIPWMLLFLALALYATIQRKKHTHNTELNKDMKKYLVLLALCLVPMMMYSVPAYRGWRTMTQPDGSTIRIRQNGDEMYHHWENEQGEIVQCDSLGWWRAVGPVPTPQEMSARRAPSATRPMRAVGSANLAPRGLVILVNYSDVSYNSANTQAAMSEMLNGDNYTYNGATGSAKKYFYDQSNGQYAPIFDVMGPVTLPHTRAYYGANDADGNDVLPGDMVVEACQLVDSEVDFSLYDNNGDGTVDFVYILYAGMGEADGGPDESIWPHNWSLSSAYSYNNCSYSKTKRKFDGKYVDNYACSGEINGLTKKRCGIGTICHEFGHVIGMVDLYDTDYSTNYDNGVTPGDWHIMDGGSYNNNGMTPPNYTTFDKYYMGWATPTILNTKGAKTLTTNYGDGYQLNSNGTLAAYSSTDTQYYIENRQQSGWDAYLPGHGMIVWKVTFNPTVWNSNAPNVTSTKGSPRYTVVSAKGTDKVQQNQYDPFPGLGKKTSFTPFSQYPLLNITENADKTISFIFIDDANCHEVDASGTGCEVLPSKTCVPNGETFTATITPQDDSYDITSVTVELGGTTLTQGTHWTLDGSLLTVQGSAITGEVTDKITITAVATKNRWTYDVLLDNATCSSESGVVQKGGTLTLTITPYLGYVITSGEHLEVEQDGMALTFGEDFTYSGTTLTVPNVQGDLGIYVMPGVDPENLCTFVPLTDVAMLEKGQQVIIVYPQTPAVASKTLTNTYLSNETSGFTVKTDGSIEVPKTSSTIGIFTLGGNTGAWTLTNSAGQKLSADASTLSWNGTNSTWTIEVNSSGNTVMKAAGSYQLYYNTGNPRFKTYTSSQASIKLYITFSGEKKANSLTFDKTGAQSIKVGSTLKNSAKAQYGTVTYSSSAADVATVDKSGLVTALKAGSTTITATVEEGAYYQGATASYTLTVNPLDVYTITWMNGESQFATTSVTEGETLVLPSGDAPAACSNGQVFVGWTTANHKDYFNKTTPPAFVSAGEEVTANTTYYAVFAAKEEGASGENTCSQSSFSAISGNLGGDSNISFTAEKGSAGTAPVINNNELRIYQGGGLLTVTANNGKAIRSLTLRSSQATKIQYKAGDGSFSSRRDVTADKEYTISNGGTDVAGGTSTRIVIKNAGTSSSNRLNVNMLSVTYTGGTTTTYTYYSEGCGDFIIKTQPDMKFDTTNVALVIGETFTNKLTMNSTGAVTYTSSDAAVASVDNAGLVHALKAGKATITASVAETGDYKAAVATYSVSVQKKEAVAWFEGDINTLTKKDNDAPFLLTVSTNSDGVVTYSSEDPSVATIDYNSGLVTPLKAGTTTITASVAETETFRSKNATCVLTIEKTNECKVVWIVSEVVLTEYGSTLTVSGEGSATLETMPPAPHNADCDAPDDAVFLGWSTINVGKVLKADEAAPADLFTELDTAPAISANATFYAVFGEK